MPEPCRRAERLAPGPMSLPVLAEGDGWIVIAKPPGLVVHRNEYAPRADAVLQRLRRQLHHRVWPIHRLDRPVSGCLLFATDRARAGEIAAAFNAGVARKRYVALVRGTFRGEGPVRVENPMKDDNGLLKEAASTVWCLGRSVEPRCSLLLVEPHTGRYHQVRRHVRDLTHPVIGDVAHGDTRVNREWRERFGVDRLALHCLSLLVPLGPEERIAATCPLFADQARLWRTLPWWDEAVAACPELGAAPVDGG